MALRRSRSMNAQLVSAIQLQDMSLEEENGIDTRTSTSPRQPAGGTKHKYYSVEEAVEKISFGRFHVLLFVIMGSVKIMEAIEIMLLAVVSPEIRCEWHLENWQVALVSTMVFIGFIACGALSGCVADRYGRWKVVFGGIVWGAYFSLLTSFAPSHGWFLFLRCMVGCGVAATSQGFVLNTEFIPAKHRGFLLPFVSVFWMLGSFLIIVPFQQLVMLEEAFVLMFQQHEH